MKDDSEQSSRAAAVSAENSAELAPITRLLQQVSGGDRAAEGVLVEQVYDQLRIIARERMAHERAGHTLQATALVNEVYMRLMAPTGGSIAPVSWSDRGQFYRAAAEAMRRTLVDHARKHGAMKRGGSVARLPLNVCDLATAEDGDQILALDDAILRLQEEDAAAAEIVRLRFFAGLSVSDTAAALGLSERTVKREWSYARVKLFRMLEQKPF